MLGQVLLRPVPERPQLRVGVVGEHHGDAHVLAVQLVVEAEGADVLRALEALDHRVDVARLHLHAPLVDLLAHPAAQVEDAPLVERTHVAGHEPALAHHLAGEVVALEVALHERRRVEPDVALLARRALLGQAGGRRRVGALQDLHHRAPGVADQAVLGREVGDGGAGHPAAGLGDAVGVQDLLGARPGLDVAPHERGQGRRAAGDALERAPRRRTRGPQRHAPDGGDRGQERDAVLVDQRAEAREQVGLEGGHDVPISKIISRYTRSIANCSVAATLADRTYIYDNSVDYAEPELMFRAVNGRIKKVYCEIHEWAQDIFSSLTP